MVGLIIGDRQTWLTNESLDDLLVLNSDKVPLPMFDPNPSIDLWWSEKTRQPSQTARKQKSARGEANQPSTSQAANCEEMNSESDTEPDDILHDWDNLKSGTDSED